MPTILRPGTFVELFSLDGEKAFLFLDRKGIINVGCSLTGYRQLKNVPSNNKELRAIILELITAKLSGMIPRLAK